MRKLENTRLDQKICYTVKNMHYETNQICKLYNKYGDWFHFNKNDLNRDFFFFFDHISNKYLLYSHRRNTDLHIRSVSNNL